ncbi:Uncharacterised protein [uncultured archaeon]|nr:Uncharacterised protein [uncultured archaeon]
MSVNAILPAMGFIAPIAIALQSMPVLACSCIHTSVVFSGLSFAREYSSSKYFSCSIPASAGCRLW